MSKNLEPKHFYHIISMDSNSPHHTQQEASTAVANINRALEDLKNKHHQCDKCGGIEPEISLWYNGADYRFVCVKITEVETGKDLLNTDYKQLCHYLMAKGYGPESADAWIKWCEENGIE